MADFIKVAARQDLNPGEGMEVDVNGRPLALFNIEGEFYAIDQVCPHAGGPLSDGWVDGSNVICPWHGWEFDLKTGECPYGFAQQTYPVKLEGEDVLVSPDANPAPGEEEPEAAPAEASAETSDSSESETPEAAVKTTSEPASFTASDEEPAAESEDGDDAGYQFTRVAAVGDVVEGQGKMVDVDGKQIALFNLEGQYYAIDDICPHMGGPLAEGSVEGDCVVCPWHGWEFEIKSGKSPTGLDQERFPCKVQQDGIHVGVRPKS